MGPEATGEKAPLLSGLVGRDKSVALSLNTRSKIDSLYGELGTDDIAVWLDCIDQRLIDARWLGMVTDVWDRIADDVLGLFECPIETDDLGVWVPEGGAKCELVRLIRFFRGLRAISLRVGLGCSIVEGA